MGFDGHQTHEGLGVAFGWDGTGSIWQAARSAEAAGRALAAFLAALSERTDERVSMLAHSLGARVALGALSGLDQGLVRRIVLLHAAEFRSRARAALATPAGQSAEVLNITTRENDLFDGLFRFFVGPHRPLDPALSAGLGVRRANWLDIRIDDPASRSALRDLGFEIPPPKARVCHWSAYMRKGMFELHRALIRSPERLPLGLLAARLPDGARRGLIESAVSRMRASPLPRPTSVPS